MGPRDYEYSRKSLGPLVINQLPGRPLPNCWTKHNEAGLIHAKITQQTIASLDAEITIAL
jgi:hypothetical protein